MELKNFEDRLARITKPEISELKHEDMLANALIKAKDKSAVSWWWLAIPLYIIGAFLMKAFFTHTTLFSNIREMSSREKYASLLFFVVIPIVFLVLNLINIRKIYLLSGSSKNFSFFKLVWFNLLMIFLSIFIIIIYLL
jgi:hypothetical protein